jgi:hypothetical protein
MKKLILEFLDKYGVKVSEDEDSATTELYMDDHTYIEFEGQGYYLPENNSSFTEDDYLLLEFLNYHYDL